MLVQQHDNMNAVFCKTVLIEFHSDDVTKMILLKLWDIFSIVRNNLSEKSSHAKKLGSLVH